MVDLHTHSTASDGELEPAELVRQAAAKGVVALALTDHDTLDGLPEAAREARLRGLRFVPGIEIEIDFGPGEFHLLGLELGEPSARLVEAAAALKEARETRNERIVELLRGAGMDIDYREVEAEARGGVAGRPHIAELLRRKRIVKTKQDAFDRYIGKGKPYYVRKECLPLGDALAMIRESGAFAIVAHPLSLFVSWTKLRGFMEEWKELGIDGIEAWHPATRVVDCERLEAMARPLGFRVTAGSDFHGKGRPDRALGRSAGDRPIPDSYLDSLARP